MPSKVKPRVIYWFRTDLRLHDSPALTAALDLNPEVFYPIWTWDPHYVYRARVGPNRWQFLTDCQRDLSESLTKLNPKQKLHIIREAPQTLLPKLFKLWKITHLVFEKDTDGYARDRDNEVSKLAKKAGVEVITKMGRTLYDSDELVKLNGNKPVMSMSQVQHASSSLGHPAKPISAPSSIPDPGNTDLSSIDHAIPSPDPDFNAVHRDSDESSYKSIMGPNKDFAVPTLAEMGIAKATSPIRGGETAALSVLKSIISNEKYTATFEKPKTAPTDFQPQSTTLLSPHLHFGSLSVREFYWAVDSAISSYKSSGKTPSTIPANLPGQLLFRDMYFAAQASLGYRYAQAHNNPICRFLAWHLPSEISPTPIGEHLLTGSYTIDDPEAEKYFRRWKHGRTGFPWIDALMRQLKHEGWIHHLGRHAVACFLTRGGCYVHWERGAEVFEEWLVDHETASNVGNWMWLSCTAFFSQFYRVYSPIAFGRKSDPEGNFIRHYVPELRNFDKKFIYEPWKAPIADQKAWGCRIESYTGPEDQPVDLKTLYSIRDKHDLGKDHTYPKPMFDFPTRREFCLGKMKEAYEIGLHGSDETVLDGSWKEIFGFEIKPGGGKVKDEMNGDTKAKSNGKLTGDGGGDGGVGGKAGRDDSAGKASPNKRPTKTAAEEEEDAEGLSREKEISPPPTTRPKRGEKRGRGQQQMTLTMDGVVEKRESPNKRGKK